MEANFGKSTDEGKQEVEIELAEPNEPMPDQNTMEQKTNLTEQLSLYLNYMEMEEKNMATVKQYRRDVLQFLAWLEEHGRECEQQAGSGQAEIEKQDMQEKKSSLSGYTVHDLTRKTVLEYKNSLRKKYKAATSNCKLAALNGFFTYLHRQDLKVKQFKIQRSAFCPREKNLTQAEYDRLVKAAKEMGNYMLARILQTICSTGIRVSELQFITVEAVQSGEISVQLKGKTRRLMLPQKLRRLLKDYIKTHGLKSGPVFVSRNGKALNRTCIWRMMKSLCEKARVDRRKVFPHNLRHLFARVFYASTKDIVKLADILGHSSINTTRIYIISTGEEHQKLLDDLDLVS